MGSEEEKVGKIYKLVPIIGTIMRSKEEEILELFFEQPTREWHFEEILTAVGIARSKALHWLKKFAQEQLIRRIKAKGAMPYYIGNYNSPFYKNRKRIFALQKLYESGLLPHLGSLKNARTVILFGSFARSDWHQESDIDLFIYGDPEGLQIAEYELKLHRDLEIFICRKKEELAKFGMGLIKNIMKGILIKGDLDFITVNLNA